MDEISYMLFLFCHPIVNRVVCFERNTKIYITKILGLDLCAETPVGDEMLKGISGGQKKRLTTGKFFRLLFFDHGWQVLSSRLLTHV